MLPRRLLNPAEHQVALTKSEGADLLVVVVVQLLLVDCRPGQGQQACFFSEIDAIFSNLLGFFLGVHGATRCIELDVGGDDCPGAYTRKNGVNLVERLGVVRRLQSTTGSSSIHALGAHCSGLTRRGLVPDRMRSFARSA